MKTSCFLYPDTVTVTQNKHASNWATLDTWSANSRFTALHMNRSRIHVMNHQKCPQKAIAIMESLGCSAVSRLGGSPGTLTFLTHEQGARLSGQAHHQVTNRPLATQSVERLLPAPLRASLFFRKTVGCAASLQTLDHCVLSLKRFSASR